MFLFCSTAGFFGMVCKNKPALSRFSNAFEIIALSFIYWKWTELLQLLEVTTTGRHTHVGSQALGEVRCRLVGVFLWQIFLEFPKVTVNPLDLGWRLCIILQQGASDVIVQHVQCCRVQGPLNSSQWVHLACSQFCMTLER